MRWRTPAGAALSHARRGWALVPLKPGTNMPARKWAHITSTTPDAIARDWLGPLFNPGILTGPSSLAVVDLDTAEHGRPVPPEWVQQGAACGADVLAILADRAGKTIPATYTVLTWRGGRHLYFLAPERLEVRNSASLIGPMIDVRGRGGLVVGAGSIRGGQPYELADDREPVPLPAWLAELAMRREPRARRPAAPDVTVTRDTTRDGHGYAAAALRGEVTILLSTRRGGRNDQLNRAAYNLGQLVGAKVLTEAEVTAALLAAAESTGLVADDGQDQAERTIASGLAAGIAQPRNRRAA